MPYTLLTAPVRKSPFTTRLFRNLIDNASFLRNLLVQEHLSTGEHNALEVPRAVGSVLFDGVHTTYSFEGDSGLGSTVTRDSTGITVVTLTGGSTYEPLMVECESMGEDWPNGPMVCSVEVLSATQFRVRHYKMSGTLGVNNNWSLVDQNYCFRVHSWPIVDPSTPAALPNPLLNRVALGNERGDFWNQLLQVIGGTRKAWLLEHDTAGAHPGRVFVKERDRFFWNGTTWTTGAGGMAIAQGGSGTGYYVLTFASSRTERYQFFFQSDWNSTNSSAAPNAVFLVGAPRPVDGTTSTFPAYGYQYITASNWWVRANADFSLTVHSTT